MSEQTKSNLFTAARKEHFERMKEVFENEESEDYTPFPTSWTDHTKDFFEAIKEGMLRKSGRARVQWLGVLAAKAEYLANRIMEDNPTI